VPWFGLGQYCGSTKVVLNFELIDSVHDNQRGAVTSGMIYGLLYKLLDMLLLGLVMFLLSVL
jgi:hypothetical protein